MITKQTHYNDQPRFRRCLMSLSGPPGVSLSVTTVTTTAPSKPDKSEEKYLENTLSFSVLLR